MTATNLIEGSFGCFGFIGLVFLLSRFLPGPVVTRTGPEGGTPVRYRLNGLLLLLLTVLAVAALAWLAPGSIAAIYRHFKSLFIAANIFSFVMLVFLFVQGRRNHDPQKRGGSQFLREFFRGSERNPQHWGVDLKMFSYRPSLLGLALMNVSFAFAQHELYGQVSARMWLYQILCLAYVANYFQFEHGMLFTWDVIEERFGWMLVWGDYVLVPFFYSLPGWFLLRNQEPVSPAALALVVVLFAFGFWLFRGANEQKHQFKQNPDVSIWGKPAKTVGGKLLASGFWGVGRKLNYTGELCMYYAWTLLCGFGSAIPYLVPFWLTVFLFHRAWRDERRCRGKYGELWLEYCRRARFRIVPFVY